MSEGSIYRYTNPTLCKIHSVRMSIYHLSQLRTVILNTTWIFIDVCLYVSSFLIIIIKISDDLLKLRTTILLIDMYVRKYPFIIDRYNYNKRNTYGQIEI